MALCEEIAVKPTGECQAPIRPNLRFWVVLRGLAHASAIDCGPYAQGCPDIGYSIMKDYLKNVRSHDGLAFLRREARLLLCAAFWCSEY
jgi:hypothetical protein